ncbi:hypothetical protein WEI85_08500 [Actinomycetes bacterium KLBMP 9797]
MTAQPTPTWPPRPARRRRWLAAVVVLWAVALAAIAYVSVRRDAPTVRDQRSVGEARPVVDRAVGELAVAAGSDAVLRISGYAVRGDCRITPVRSGQTLERQVTVYTREADGPALLDRMAERLPASYDAGVRHTDKLDSLRADAGEFVSIRGRVTAPGVTVFTVDTGCRPPASLPSAPQLAAADRARVERLMTALGVPASTASLAEAPCPAGGVVRTMTATAESAPSRPVAPPQGATAVVNTADLTAYRTPTDSVSISFDGTTLTTALTTPCP